MTQRSEPSVHVVCYSGIAHDSAEAKCVDCHDYVLKSAYDALAAENARLREENKDFTYILDKATAKVLADTKALLDEATALLLEVTDILELHDLDAACDCIKKARAFLQRTDAGREEKE